MADSPLVQKLLALRAEGKLSSAEDLLELGAQEVDTEDIVELGRLNWSPRDNWVDQNPPGLPKYVEEIALAIMRSSGYPREKAIPIAISRIKVWATGKGVNADTQAKAIKALAEWEALKAKAAAKRAAKKLKG